MNVNEFYAELEKLYPRALSCEWDNDGLMVSCGAVSEISRVLVALDATDEAINYAAANGFDTVLVHHPLIFRGLKEVTPDVNVPRKVIFSLLNGISVISLHPRLDAGDGGVNDCLAETLGLSRVRKFGDSEAPECGRIGELDREYTIDEFAEYVKEKLGCAAVRIASLGDEVVRTVAVIGGGGKDFIGTAKDEGADVLLTGEVSYNDMLDAVENGIPVVAAGHYETEVVVCRRLSELARTIAGAEAEIFTYTPVKVV